MIWTGSNATSANKCLTLPKDYARLFEVMREIDIEKKIHELNVAIVLNGPMKFLDPIKDHRHKVAKFNIEKQKLLNASKK